MTQILSNNMTNQERDAVGVFLHAIDDLVALVNVGDTNAGHFTDGAEFIYRSRLLNALLWMCTIGKKPLDLYELFSNTCRDLLMRRRALMTDGMSENVVQCLKDNGYVVTFDFDTCSYKIAIENKSEPGKTTTRVLAVPLSFTSVVGDNLDHVGQIFMCECATEYAAIIKKKPIISTSDSSYVDNVISAMTIVLYTDKYRVFMDRDAVFAKFMGHTKDNG